MAKKGFFVALMAVLILAAVPVNAQSDFCDGRDSVSLRVDDWSSGDRVEYMNQVVEAFEAEYPCIDVVLEPNIGDDQNTRRLTWLSAGTSPDLMAYPPEWAALYMEASDGQAYIDLTPYVEGENGIKIGEDVYEGIFEQGKYDGKPVALPKDYSTSAFYINTALFDAAGIPYPEEGWTWDDALDIALELTLDANGNNANSPDFDPDNVVQWGIDIVNDGWWRAMQSYLQAWGTLTISEDGTTTTGILNSDAAVEALEWYRDLVFEHHVAPSATVIGAVEGGRVQMFQDGKIAMGLTFHGPWWQDVLNETPNLEWAVVPVPAGPAGHHSVLMWLGWGISGQSKDPDAAWELLKWLTTEPGQRVFALKALSGNPVVSQEMQRETDPYWGVFIAETNFLGPLEELRTPYYSTCVSTPASDMMKRLLADGGDQLDVKAELDKLAADADACLAEGGKQ
ncbi:MAG: sugar ABC transporter substrate-binding protein [Chloroflexi bacterium]|nr:sugar ABC transporter substrate-binding protein [Chloroflexota bacterium]